MVAFGSPPTEGWRDSFATNTSSRPQSNSLWSPRRSSGIEAPRGIESTLAGPVFGRYSADNARERLSRVSSSSLRENDSISESGRNIRSSVISRETENMLQKFWFLNPDTRPGQSIASPMQDTYFKLTGGEKMMAGEERLKVGEAMERPSSLSKFGSREGTRDEAEISNRPEESGPRLSQGSELTIGVESVGGRTEPTSPARSAFNDRKPAEALPGNGLKPAQKTLEEFSEQKQKAEGTKINTGRKIR